MGTTFIQRILNTLFSRKKEVDSISEIKDQALTRNKARSKTAKINAKSKTNIKGEHKAETGVETEERIRSCAVEVKTCIDLINHSTSTHDKSKGVHEHAKADDRKAVKSAGNQKTSSDSNSDSATKRGRQDISPAEMVVLLAKVEEKVSEAVVKAKEKDSKKKEKKKK